MRQYIFLRSKAKVFLSFLSIPLPVLGTVFHTTLEHKNMPMDDALGLVDRDFERYCQNAKEGRLPPRRSAPSKDEVPNLLSKAAAGEQLDQGQLQAVINVLQRQQQAIPSHASGRPIMCSGVSLDAHYSFVLLHGSFLFHVTILVTRFSLQHKQNP